MKITLVTHSMYPDSIGGREKYVYYLADALGKKGHEVKVFTCAPVRNSESRQHENFTVYYFPSLDIPLIAAKYRIPIALFNKLLRDNADVIHAHDLHHFTTFISALAASVKKKPLLVTEHGYPPLEGMMNFFIRIYDKTLLRMINRNAAKFIGVSDFISKELVGRYKISQEKITTVHTGANTNENTANIEDTNGDGTNSMFQSMFKEKFSLNGKRIILGVGRLTKEKGFQFLIQAFEKIGKKFPDTFLVIIGPQTKYKIALDNLVRNLGIVDRVLFTGPLEDEMVKDAIRSCEMIVIPSSYEPFPLVALEALSHKKPVIASAVGGLPEIFSHEANGLLINPEDSADLEAKMEMLLTNEQMKNSLIANSEETLQKFNWQAFVEKMESIYEKAAAK